MVRTDTEPERVFRDTIKAHRGDYFVEYDSARLPYCATLSVTFPKRAGDVLFVREVMDRELELWLQRYPVPVMVHGIDEKEDRIRFGPDQSESALMGYIDPATQKTIKQWSIFRDAELPSEQMTEQHLAKVYHDVPFRKASEVRDKGIRQTRRRALGAKVIVLFIVVVPLLIEIVALGVGILGHILAAISIAIGLYKAGKAFGWIKPTSHDNSKSDEEMRIRHHHHHCELNPLGFARLRAENCAREAAERVRKDDEELKKAAEKK